MRRQTAVSAMVVAVAAALAGCGTTAHAGSGPRPSASGGATSPPAGSARLVGHEQPLRVGALTAADVAADDTAFGFRLFGRLCAAAPDANLTLSPASAAQALGMLDAGAGGSTRASIDRLLGRPAWGPAVVAALHSQTVALGAIPQVTVSNHVFEQTGFTPTGQTLDDLATAYSSDLRQVDFRTPAATQLINQVVSHDTDGLIPTLFDSPLDATTRTVLTDAILLDAKWASPFPSSSPAAFHTAGGTSVTASMMDGAAGEFATRASGGWESAVLPYVGSLQAVAILPPAGRASCQTPGAATVSALTSGPSAVAGVELPKLSLSQTLPLTQTLAGMGLPLEGDYTGLGSTNTHISDVIQKVVMKVDENGTKAAAATGVAVTESLAVAAPRVVTFDRPFFLVVEDSSTHTPLFVARVADPTKP